MISRSTIAAATRVIQYAATRPIVLRPGLMPSSKVAAQGAEARNADGLGAVAAQNPIEYRSVKSLPFISDDLRRLDFSLLP
jgi:hypothetical protein